MMDMDGNISQFCAVLRAGLWNSIPEEGLAAEDMRRIWIDAQKQAVSGLIAQGFLNTGRIGPKTSEMLQNKLLSIAAMNFKQAHILADSVRALQAEGIEPILLKGHGVASYYHQPLLRECGDIDLYVRPHEYSNAFDILAKSLDNVDQMEFVEDEKHSTIVVKGIPIELHQFLDVLAPKYDAAFQMICDPSRLSGDCPLQVDDVTVDTLDSTINGMFIFEHIWSHFVAAGVGFRQMCDWCMLLHAECERIDRVILKEMLDSLSFMKPWQVFGHIAVNLLGLPEDEMPFYNSDVSKYATKVLKMIMKEGNFGHEREDRWSETGYKVFDTVKQFFVITRRYTKLIPMFGDLVFQEYKTKMLYHLRGSKS